MKLLFIFFVYFESLLFSNLQNICQNSSISTILYTESGKIRGECHDIKVRLMNSKTEIRQVHKWLSVPFAEPPIGNKRFKQAQPVDKWDDVKDGTKWPNMCMQIPFDSRDLQIKLGQKVIERNMSEDCLYLNIYVPSIIYQKVVIERNIGSYAPIFVLVKIKFNCHSNFYVLKIFNFNLVLFMVAVFRRVQILKVFDIELLLFLKLSLSLNASKGL